MTEPIDEFHNIDPLSNVQPGTYPYPERLAGMGIVLAGESPAKRVYHNARGDRARFNEDGNRYGKYLLGKMLNHMHERKLEGGKVGEQKSFEVLLREETERLATLADVDSEPPTERRITLIWNMMKGFNTDDDSNKELDALLLLFARIRLGNIPKEEDEFMAAISAVQLRYLHKTKDNKTVGSGTWTLPAVHLLDGHLRHLGMTPIAFAPEYAEDQKFKERIRSTTSNKIWINKKPALVENREEVIRELTEFAASKEVELAIPEDEGAPEEEEQEDAPVGKRRRRSLRD